MDENVYDVTLEMIEKLKAMPKRVRMAIANLIENNASEFEDLYGYSQMIGGVVKGNPPFFFEIEYVKDPDTPVIMLDIEEITLDDYLDYIDEEKVFKSNEQETNDGFSKTEGSDNE